MLSVGKNLYYLFVSQVSSQKKGKGKMRIMEHKVVNLILYIIFFIDVEVTQFNLQKKANLL